MALPKFEKDISYISKLADQPNDTAGGELSAAQLKARFDAAGNDIKEYINTVLIPFLQGASAAANLGLEPISGITDATDLQSAIEALKRAIDNTAAGELPDASLTGSKLVPETITGRELALNAVQGKNVAPKTITGENAADKSFGADVFADEFLQHRHIGKYVIEDENIADNTIDASGKIKDGTMTAKKYAPLSIPTIAYQDKSVTTEKIAPNAVTSDKLDENLVADLRGVYIGSETPTGENLPKLWVNPADTRLPLTMTKVWENPNPTAAFAAQTIPLSIPENALVMVAVNWSAESTSNVVYGWAMVGEPGRIYTQWNDRGGRLFTASTTGVTFQGGMYCSKTESLAANNNYMIPKAIYIITGVN